jgi:large conductance mechanosensitive channel
MGFLSEFKAFAMRGNVIDLAVGVIMGSAFGKIVNSLVTDIVMPPLGYAINNFDFRNLKIDLTNMRVITEAAKPAAEAAKPAAAGAVQAAAAPPSDVVTINIGNFLQITIEFIVVALCIFLVIKAMNTLWRKKEEAPKPAELSTQEKLLVEIRDLMKNQGPARA